MNTSKLPSTDRIFGIAAFLISMGTFFIYIYEARLLQKQQYASALPYLEMWNSGGESNYRLLLVNNGVGPAFIQAVQVRYRGKVYKMDHVKFLRFIRQRTDPPLQYISTNIVPGRSIPAGREIELIKVLDAPESGARLKRLFGSEEAQIEIIYTSVYDEKWQLKSQEAAPYKLDD
jgi:hypothetical protein